MTKLLNVIIVLLAAALVAVILYPQIQANRPQVVRFACDSTSSALPFLIGIEESLFVKNRIIPELVFYSDPDQALEDLFAGRVDVGAFPYAAVFRRVIEHDDTLKVFMSEDFRQSLPVDAIVVPVASKAEELKDLRKRTLGYPPQLRGYLPPFLINANIPSEDITLVEVPFSEMPDRLRSGEIDAAWFLEPLICAMDSAEFRVLQDAALARFVSSPFPGTAVGFAPEYMDEHKVVLNRLKISTDAAVAMAENNPDRAKLILGKYFPYCTEVCGLCRIPELQRLIEVNKPAVSALASRLKIAGVFDEDVPTNDLFVEPIKLTR